MKVLILFSFLLAGTVGAATLPATNAPAVKPGKTTAEDLFTRGVIPKIRLEIPREGLAVLRRSGWGGGDSQRPDARVTVREGDRIYTNVAVHLKGAAGSFRPVDDRPCLTLNFDKFAPGQRFHGLRKISLNN